MRKLLRINEEEVKEFQRCLEDSEEILEPALKQKAEDEISMMVAILLRSIDILEKFIGIDFSHGDTFELLRDHFTFYKEIVEKSDHKRVSCDMAAIEISVMAYQKIFNSLFADLKDIDITGAENT